MLVINVCDYASPSFFIGFGEQVMVIIEERS